MTKKSPRVNVKATDGDWTDLDSVRGFHFFLYLTVGWAHRCALCYGAHHSLSPICVYLSKYILLVDAILLCRHIEYINTVHIFLPDAVLRSVDSGCFLHRGE
jgi:hypothetical protein